MSEPSFKDFFAWLDEEGFSTSPPHKIMDGWSNDDYLSFVNDVWKFTPPPVPLEPHALDFVANSSLSGAATTCIESEYRIAQTDKLARFVAFYADHARVQNPFEHYVYCDEFFGGQRARIRGDIALLYHLRPLFEAGLLSFSMRHIPLCAEAKRDYWDPFVERFGPAENDLCQRLRKRVLSECTFTYDRDPGRVWIRIDGPRDYIPDGCMYFYIVDLSDDELISFLTTTKPNHRMTSEEIEATGLLGAVIDQTISDYFFRCWYSQTLGVSYLTDSFLDTLAPSQESPDELSYTTLAETLSHPLPTLSGESLGGLVHLRKNEGEAFQAYRCQIQKLFADVDLKHGSQSSMKQAFADLIAPELRRIDYAVHSAAERLASNAKTNALIGAGMIAFGLATGEISANPTAIASSLVGSGYLAKAVQDGIKSHQTVDLAKGDSFFFLWKALR